MNKKLVKGIGALCTVFALAATSTELMAARNTEPVSCRDFNPEQASIIVDFNTGAILHAEHADELRHPASLVKMMTALKIFDALEDGTLSLHDTFKTKVTPAVLATKSNSHSTWIGSGHTLTVEQALKAITVASANNITVMMAEKLAGSEQAFTAGLNKKAKELGMTRTVFKNATGLPHDEQVTTAQDMVKLSRHLIEKYPQYFHYFSEEMVEFGPWKKHNHNELAMKNDHIDGIKTGFTCASGYNLAASAEKNGRHIIGIVLGSRTPHKRNVKMDTLFNGVFKNQKTVLTEQNNTPSHKPTGMKNKG